MFRDVFEDDAIDEQHSQPSLAAGRRPEDRQHGCRTGAKGVRRSEESCIGGMKTYRTKRKETAAAKKNY
jgi:hypothetical protein